MKPDRQQMFRVLLPQLLDALEREIFNENSSIWGPAHASGSSDPFPGMDSILDDEVNRNYISEKWANLHDNLHNFYDMYITYSLCAESFAI